MQFVNSKSGKKEPLTPLDPRHIKLYVCGPTVYDRIHLGNARPLVVFDVLYRLLKQTSSRVTYVRNITDIDDKIITRAREKKLTTAALTAQTISDFHDDTCALLCLAPTHQPLATGHIPQMIALIETLLANGHAYEVAQHVLFSMPSLPASKQLTAMNRDALIEGARVDPAPYKRDPSDFVLWKPSPEGVIGWDSPFGYGRPGWHIECSAMAGHYLGKDFDIHGGGCDLLFPHHYNECAQSLCAYPEHGFARHWLHNGYVLVEGEKMSKSLGNFHTVRDLLVRYDGEILRLALLMTHYRKPFDFSETLLRQAGNILDKFYQALQAALPLRESIHTDAQNYDINIYHALADDLNTPRALTHLHEICAQISLAKGDKKIALGEKLQNSAAFLGLLPRSGKEWFSRNVAESHEQEIQQWIKMRNHARKNKDFQTADDIRDKLHRRGIILEDTGTQTLWKRR